MIDLHLHVLPDVDDGSSSLGETKRMLGLYRDFGFERIVATPHLFDRLDGTYQEQIDRAEALASAIALEQGVLLERGFEVMLHPDVPDRLSAGEPLTLAGSRAILVEFPFSIWPSFAESVLFEMQTMGYQLILAHPERYDAVHRDPTRVTNLVDRGIATQVTFASLLGDMGRDAKKTAETLLQKGAVTILATDAHSAGTRLQAVPASLERARELVGEDGTALLTRRNPFALLTGQEWSNPRAHGLTSTRDGVFRRLSSWISGD